MMGRTEKMVGGDEDDALSGWRKVLHFYPGQRKKAKRKFNKRIRQQYRFRNICNGQMDS